MSVTTTALHLLVGLEEARQRTDTKSWPYTEGCSFIDFVQAIEHYANTLEEMWEAEQKDVDCPGCYDYEVTEPMGAWLYDNFSSTQEEFADELRRYFKQWLEDNK